MKLRSLTIGLTLLTSGTVIGAASTQFASADVSSGDRPVLVPIDTCRIADTRPDPNTVGPRTSALSAAETMTVDAQEAGTDCTGKIPAGASALSLNITAVGATSNSFLTVWPGGARPNSSALNPTPGQRVFNAVTTELAADQTFQIYNDSGDVNVILDVNGYYEHHDHDDRYDISAEVDAKISAALAEAPLPLAYGRIRANGDIRINSGAIGSASYDAVLKRFVVSFTGLDYDASNFATVATPHCGFNLEPMITVDNFNGNMVVTIFDDDIDVDDNAGPCSFSFVVYAAP